MYFYILAISNQKLKFRDFPGGPVVKTSPSNAGCVGSIPGRGAKIPHALWPKNQNIKQKQYFKKFTEEIKKGPHQKNLKKKKKEIEILNIAIYKSMKKYEILRDKSDKRYVGPVH